MGTDKPDKSGSGKKEAHSGPTAPSTPNEPNASSNTSAAGTPTAPSPASAPNQSSVRSDPTAAIMAIEAIKTMALNAPTATSTAEAVAAIRALAASVPGARSAATEALKVLGMSSTGATINGGAKRAICLGGGGPAVGLHIGALEALKDRIDFGNENSVWALSCIGAWVGVVYNQATQGKEIEETYNFFHDVFRDDKSFKSFPLNTVFTPDWVGNAEAMQNFLLDLENYKNAFLPRQIMESFAYTLSFLRDRKNWRNFSEGDFNRWTLNHVLAVNPAVRFLTALVYKSAIDGRSRLHYKDSKFLKDIKFEELDRSGKPFIFYNAFNFKEKDIDLFANNAPRSGRKGHKAISAASLCACSALPFIEQTIKVDKDVYCEGALLDTVNFKRLLEDHHNPNSPLEEIWINRIVDAHQIRKPENLYDSMANLCELFAATVGEDDVKLFKYHVQENNKNPKHRLKWTGIIVEIKVDSQINFQWSHSNLEHGRERGKIAADAAYRLYAAYKHKKEDGKVLMIPDDLTEAEVRAVLRDLEDSDIKAVLGRREPP
jgi:predicted acylesterase/phospholipase RssA